MAETVYILGAGASQHTGAPLTSGFYRRIREIGTGQTVGEFEQDFRLVLDAYDRLARVHAKADMKYRDNFEELLASFELGALLGRLGDMEESEVTRLPDALTRVIASTIERTMLYPLSPERVRMPHKAYLDFARHLAQKRAETPSAVITFNYDLGLEVALRFANASWTY